jgi:phage protein D
MPRKKAEEKIPATSVSEIRRKAATLSAREPTREPTTAVKAAPAKAKVTRAPKKKMAAAANGDSLLSLSGAVNGHTKGGRAQGAANGHPSAEQVAQRAYFLWLERGCPQGLDEQNWVDAERELGVHQ